MITIGSWAAALLGFINPIGASGAIWAWGNNASGQLGLGDTVYRSSPTQVGELTNWLKIAGGNYFTAAINDIGELWAWGQNLRGQLGLDDVIYRSAPVQVGILTNWNHVSTGKNHVLALKTDSTLWAWGHNYYGQLGLDSTIYQSSPVQIGALTTWLSVSSGGYHTIATQSDGTIWAWGHNYNGQLGLGFVGNITTYRSSPSQIGSLTTWLQLGAGKYHSLATHSDHTLWTWGMNYYGQLGIPDLMTFGNWIDGKSSPTQVGVLTKWLSISGGGYHSLATSVPPVQF